MAADLLPESEARRDRIADVETVYLFLRERAAQAEPKGGAVEAGDVR